MPRTPNHWPPINSTTSKATSARPPTSPPNTNKSSPSLPDLAEWARNDIGDYDRIGENARFFDDAPNRLERPAPAPPKTRKPQQPRAKQKETAADGA